MHYSPVVFGHYWHLPPLTPDDPAAPPHPLGSQAEREHKRRRAPEIPPAGRTRLARSQRFVCVDFMGVSKGGGPPCVGAYRWPEHEVAWASG